MSASVSDTIKVPLHYTEAKRHLAAMVEFDEVLEFRGKSLAMETYAFFSKDAELVSFATEIKRRATRRIGELMAELKAADKLAKNAGRNQHRVFEKPTAPTLAEQGIDKNLADSARKLAAMPEANFEAETERLKAVASAVVLGEKEVIAEIRAQKNTGKKAKRAAKEKELATKITALPDAKFGVIYADPEWKFEFWSDAGKNYASPDNHYPTSPLDDIKARPVADIAADDCILFQWATYPMIGQPSTGQSHR